MAVDATPGPLAGITVLDISRSASGAWCTRLLADMGADVLMFEPRAGHPLRGVGIVGGGRSPIAEYLLADKRSTLADVTTPPGRLAFESCLPGADVVVSSFSAAEADRLQLRHDTLNAPALVLAHITPHGLTGPLAAVPGNDLTAAAWSGWASINGLAGREPLRPVGWQASYCAGTGAAAAIISALIARRTSGAGMEIDIAEAEVMAAAIAPAVLREQYTGKPLERPAKPDLTTGPVPVADGHFALTISRAHFWREAMNLLGLTDLADDPRWETGWYRQANKDLYVGRVQEAMRGWSKQQLFDELALRRVVAGPVLSLAELRENEHLRERGFWTEVEGSDLVFPGAPFKMSKSPLNLRKPAPQPGSSAAVMRKVPSREDSGPRPAPGAKAPLSGFRGIVLTQAWAGTYCTELLAFLGADVIQVEVRKRLDSWRGSYDTPMPAALKDIDTALHAWNCNPLYNSVNLNKRCVTLDLQDPEGLAVFRRLVAHADFVAENFSPRVMGNLGIGYEELDRLRPGVILCSLSAYGHTGPWANVPGIGGTIEPTSGMSALLGYADGPPLNSGQMYPDPVAGLLGATAIAAALYHREQTGEGQYIDLSMQEANLAFIGDAAIEFSLTGRQPPRRGNRHVSFAPHGVFPCADGGWLALACESDEQWAALCGIVPGLDPALAATARKRDEDAIEQTISAWTCAMDRNAAFKHLASLGMPAAPVLTAAEVASSLHLRERGVLIDVTHPEAGTWTQVASPFHFTGIEPPPIRPAPLLGQHNQEVFQELLGMTEPEFAALAGRGISGSGPPD